MKTLALLPSVALVLALTAGAAGQKTQPAQPQPSPNAMPPGAMNPWAAAQDAPTPYNEWMKSTVSFNFPGGTLKDYVEAVRAAAKDKPVNVMFRDGAEQAQIAATSMREVSIVNALQAPTDFGNMTQTRGMTLYLQQVTGGNMSGSSSGMPTTVPAFVYVGAVRNYVAGQDVSVLSLNEVCSPPWVKDTDPCSLPSADVLKAVETAVEAVGDRSSGKPPELAFHRESGLLVVKGTDRQIAAAKNVIQSLGQDVRRFRETRAVNEDKRKNDVGEVEVLKIRMVELEKTLADQRNETNRERARANEVRKELDDAMRQMTELRMKLEAMGANSAPGKKVKE